MYLYGASGHAKVIIDLLQSQETPIEGLIDDNPEIKTLLNYPVYSTVNDRSPIIISIGNNTIRKKIAESLSVSFGIAHHTSSIISPMAQIEEGTVVMQGAIIQSCAQIGKHCILNSGSSVDHDCVIANYVHISPHATLCGNVEVGEGTHIGAGAIITPGVKIGKWCLIHAGALISRDIPDYSIAGGNSTRFIKTKNHE